MLAAGTVAAILAPSASASSGLAEITCAGSTSATVYFENYQGFPSGSQTVRETVYVDGAVAAQTDVTFMGPSGGHRNSLTVAIGSGTHTVEADAFSLNQGAEVRGFPRTKTLTCSPSPCPAGTKANFRWHYSANGSSGSWSGTKTATCPSWLTEGPQAMEGDLKVSPGTTLKVGYDFTVPGNHASFPLTVGMPQVVFAVHCVSGATPSASTFTVSMPTQTYSVTNDQWYPSGDQSSPLVYQGSIAVPNLCGGGELRLDQGGTFTARVS